MHQKSIDNLKKELENLLRKKLDILIKKDSDNVANLGHYYFSYNKDKELGYTTPWNGTFYIIENLFEFLTRSDIPYDIYYQISEVNLE